jgi:hypothetical protein
VSEPLEREDCLTKSRYRQREPFDGVQCACLCVINLQLQLQLQFQLTLKLKWNTENKQGPQPQTKHYPRVRIQSSSSSVLLVVVVVVGGGGEGVVQITVCAGRGNERWTLQGQRLSSGCGDLKGPSRTTGGRWEGKLQL